MAVQLDQSTSHCEGRLKRTTNVSANTNLDNKVFRHRHQTRTQEGVKVQWHKVQVEVVQKSCSQNHSITSASLANITSTLSPRLFARASASNMKFSTTLSMSTALTTTAQACVRIPVSEVSSNTREITLRDQDKVSDLSVPFKQTSGNDDIWQGSDYTVTVNNQSNGGSVTFSNGHCKSASFPAFLNRLEITTSHFAFDQRDTSLCHLNVLIWRSPVAGGLSQQARKQFTRDDGKTQSYYCLWDNYDCGNYACGLP